MNVQDIKDQIQAKRDSLIELYTEKNEIISKIHDGIKDITLLEDKIKQYLLADHLDNVEAREKYLEVMDVNLDNEEERFIMNGNTNEIFPSPIIRMVGKRNKLGKIQRMIGMSLDVFVSNLKTEKGIEKIKQYIIRPQLVCLYGPTDTSLTSGKTYFNSKSNTKYFLVVDDNGNEEWYSKTKFGK